MAISIHILISMLRALFVILILAPAAVPSSHTKWNPPPVAGVFFNEVMICMTQNKIHANIFEKYNR